MGDGNSESVKNEFKGKSEEDLAESSELDSDETDKPVLKKEPSFSRWCKERESTVSEISLADADSEEFELPLLHENGSVSEKSDREGEIGNGDRKYLPLDIENGLHIADSEENSDKILISPWFVLKILVYILLWYTLSTCLTLYNKEMLGKKYYKFPAPLLMNTVHFTMQAVLSRAILYFRSWGSEREGDRMTWKDYFIRVVPTALGTALDINLSNESLVFITVTFATMCKSAAPIFILVFAFAFRLEKPSFKLLGIILIISIGVLLTVAKATEFNLLGFLLIMLAAVMSGFRWSMTQILLQKEAYGLKDPITLMSYVTPVMAIATAFLSLGLDPWSEFSKNHFFDNSTHIVTSCLLMLLGGALAFFMVLTEYILVSATSAVTVTIAGIFKEAVTILVAVLFFNDPFTWLKGVGLATIVFGVSLFNWYKYKKFKKGEPNENKEESLSHSTNGAAKYVILDDTELQDDTY